MFSSFPLSNATNGSDPSLNLTLSSDFEISITTGESITVPFQTGTVSTFSEILVGWEGFGQHFVIPISSLIPPNNISRRSTHVVDSTNWSFSITLPSGSLQTGTRMLTNMLLRMRNAIGNLGPVRAVQTIIATSQHGSLRVRLTWYKEVDLDLHVVDPNGEEIYWGDKRSTQQAGFLDLDSNPACRLDRIKIENIYYEMAITGKYIVRVDLYQACGITSSINFEVFAKGCNISETVTGSFSPSDADGGSRGSGRTILTFVASCNAFLAQGTVSYLTREDRVNPLGALARVVDAEGNVFGESQVEMDSADEKRGIFFITYNPLDVNAKVYLEFLATNHKIIVKTHSGNVHIYREPNSIVPVMETSSVRTVEIDVEQGSGAFHILYTMTRMLPHYRAYGGKPSDYPLNVVWEQYKSAQGASPNSHFLNKIISIQGNRNDPDEFDDSVLLHEFGHLINDLTGAEITGTGLHGSGQISPNFAFSEGFATYLGQMELQHFQYIDKPGMNIDLSNLYSFPLGTSIPGDHSSGRISELVVASAALKMDFSLSLSLLIRQALTDPNQLLKLSNYNQFGDTTAVDLADMIRIIGCNLDNEKKEKLDKLLKTQYSLP